MVKNERERKRERENRKNLHANCKLLLNVIRADGKDENFSSNNSLSVFFSNVQKS